MYISKAKGAWLNDICTFPSQMECISQRCHMLKVLHYTEVFMCEYIILGGDMLGFYKSNTPSKKTIPSTPLWERWFVYLRQS